MAFDLDDEENDATRVANGASKECRDKNMDIEVGEYVRTKIGEIYKVENVKDYGFMCDKFYYQITKHSKQLIDLIEVGDIVNKELVIDIIDITNDKEEIIGRKLITQWRSAQFTGLDIKHYIYANDIQTVLTKESYIANCYEVGGKQ